MARVIIEMGLPNQLVFVLRFLIIEPGGTRRAHRNYKGEGFS